MAFRCSFIITPFLAKLKDTESQRERIRLIKICSNKAEAMDIAFPLSNTSVFSWPRLIPWQLLHSTQMFLAYPQCHDSAEVNGLFQFPSQQPLSLRPSKQSAHSREQPSHNILAFKIY